jgi:hypothetical protein
MRTTKAQSHKDGIELKFLCVFVPWWFFIL